MKKCLDGKFVSKKLKLVFLQQFKWSKMGTFECLDGRFALKKKFTYLFVEKQEHLNVYLVSLFL